VGYSGGPNSFRISRTINIIDWHHWFSLWKCFCLELNMTQNSMGVFRLMTFAADVVHVAFFSSLYFLLGDFLISRAYSHWVSYMLEMLTMWEINGALKCLGFWAMLQSMREKLMTISTAQELFGCIASATNSTNVCKTFGSYELQLLLAHAFQVTSKSLLWSALLDFFASFTALIVVFYQVMYMLVLPI